MLGKVKLKNRIGSAPAPLPTRRRGTGPAHVYSLEEIKLALMVRTNPAVLSLVSSFGLDTGNGVPLRLPEGEELDRLATKYIKPQRPPGAPISRKMVDKLREICEALIKPEKAISYAHLVRSISQGMDVSDERAMTGIQMMTEVGLLSPLPEGYYLRQSFNRPEGHNP